MLMKDIEVMEGYILVEKMFKDTKVVLTRNDVDDIVYYYRVCGVHEGSKFNVGDCIVLSQSYINHGTIVIIPDTEDSYMILPEGAVLARISGKLREWYEKNCPLTMKDRIKKDKTYGIMTPKGKA